MSEYGQESRKVELAGILKLEAFYGKRATVLDLAHTGGHDFEILFPDGRFAIGEFSWLANPNSVAMWKAITKREKPQQISLPEGWGLWTMTLDKPVNINTLENLAPAWIQEIIATNTDHLEIYDGWPNTILARSLREFGVSRIHKFSTDDDKVLFLPMGGGGAVPPDLIPLRDTIQFLLENSDKVRSNCTKLIKLEADEKHVYLRIGELVPNLQTWALWSDRNPAEIPDIEFPDHISHIWLDAGSNQIRNILWERGKQPTYF